MKKLLAILAVFALVLAACEQPTNDDNPVSVLPKLTIRNESSYILTNVTFSGISFAASGNDLPTSSQSVKQLTADDVNKTGYITFTRKDIGIALRTEAISITNQDYTFTFLDTTVVEEVGNSSNKKSLAQITFVSEVTVGYETLPVAKNQNVNLGEAVINRSKQFDFTLKNTGVGKLLLTAGGTEPVKISGDTANVFSVVQQPSSHEIAPNNSLPFKISINPKAAQEYTAVVTVISNDQGGDFIFTIRATGVPPKPVVEMYFNTEKILQNGTIDTGVVIITQPKNIIVDIINTGTAVLTLDTANITITGTDAEVFTKITNPGGNISENGQSSFIIKCEPIKEGESNAVLVIPTNDNSRNPVIAYLKATGHIQRPQITIKQGSTAINQNGEFDFASVYLGDQKDVVFTIGNSGDAPLAFETVNNNRINLENNSGNQFNVITQPSAIATVAPEGTTTFTVRFNPLSVGTNFTAAIQIKTNSRDNDEFSFAVKGSSFLAVPIGVTAAAQSSGGILLSWNPVPGAASYKVYYGTNSSAITTLADSAVIGTSFTHTGLSAGTTYYYCITAQDDTSESSRSQPVSMITLPGIPSNLRNTASTQTSITVAWGVVTGAAGYKVYYATSTAGSKTLVSTVSSGTSYTHTGLSANTTYYYFVTAVNNAGEGAYTEALTARTLMAPLSPPNNVTATALSTNSIQVTWGAVAGAVSYKVYRATRATGTRTLLDTVTTTSFTSGGLEARTYWYNITAMNADNIESDWSVSASMIPKPNVPSNVSAAGQDGYAFVEIDWSYVSSEESYRIYYATSLTGVKTLAGTTDSTYYRHIGTANTTYYYWVTAVNAAGESDYSLHASALTPPAAPMNLRVTSKTTTSISLAWNAVAGAAYYYIYGVTPPTQTGTTMTVSGCTPKTWYYFSVRAYNSAGVCGPSSDIEVQTN